jgi:hypothetical protein
MYNIALKTGNEKYSLIRSSRSVSPQTANAHPSFGTIEGTTCLEIGKYWLFND